MPSSAPDSSRFPHFPQRPKFVAGPRVQESSRSGARRLDLTNRREDLINAEIAHWLIVDSATDGKWVARCMSCGGLRTARFDAGQSIPRCQDCETSAPRDTTMKLEREKHFARVRRYQNAG
jgi:hypothetical protein